MTQDCLQLDKDESIVSTFSVFLINKYAGITTQKNSYMECFSFGQQRFVFAHLFPEISVNSTKFHFQPKRKDLSNDFAFFSKMTVKYQGILMPNDVRIEHVFHILDTSELAGSKLKITP